jgi:hypothetical protein
MDFATHEAKDSPESNMLELQGGLVTGFAVLITESQSVFPMWMTVGWGVVCVAAIGIAVFRARAQSRDARS